MRQFIFSFILFILLPFVAHAQDSIPLANNVSLIKNVSSDSSAINAYDEGDFDRAASLWKQELEEQKAKGLESAMLYYNLGNAYFRSGNIAHAILNYERAQLINPADKDIRHNIEYANTRIEDKILVADTFFISVWFNSLQNILSSNGWALFAIISFLFLVCTLVAFFFSRNVVIKKVSFYIGILGIVLTVFANVFSFRQKDRIEHRNTAIIMAASAPIHSSPSTTGKELFVLHAGTKVTITKEDSRWIEVEISDGSIGWIQREKLEII